jgi:hypothetical protein
MGNKKILSEKGEQTMTDYGKGTILGTATVLPATSALGIAVADKLHPVVLIAFLIINAIMFIILASHISRYFFNKNV